VDLNLAKVEVGYGETRVDPFERSGRPRRWIYSGSPPFQTRLDGLPESNPSNGFQ